MSRGGRAAWWLVGPDGARRRIDAAGVLVGRSPRCEIVLRDPRASRVQALVYLDGEHPRLVLLGKGRTERNGARAERESALAAGDRILLPGLELELASLPEGDAADGAEEQGWVLEKPGGGLFGVSHSPFSVGGDATDDLLLEAWPARALTLHLAQGGLYAEANEPVVIDGVAVEPGGLARLAPGSAIELGGRILGVVGGGQFGAGSTLLTGDGGARAERVELEFLPRGGRLRVLGAGGREQCGYLPGARCDLMALLLSPPEPHVAGSLLEDDWLIARLWPNQARTRIDLNTLVYRLRRDLVAAGIDATTFVERAPGGGGTRLGIGPGVAIRVG
jgi:hypothetical protein